MSEIPIKNIIDITEQEFADHIFAVNRVNDELYKPNGNCYI